MITAPFNFVPLSEKIFFPNWAEKVSHDIPFEDAQSGVIDITITAKSPIFVRDHKKQEEFCQDKNGEYYIPSSSVKGMVRNVLEIMSFSKMTQVDDDTYAVRDLRNRELYMSKMTPDKTFCGFLKKVDGKYLIEDCGKPGRIKHSEIDKIFNMDFASKFKQGKFKNKAKDKTATVKYDMIKSSEFEHGFEYVKKDVNREIYRYAKNSNKKGTLVLTGQPSARKEPQGQKPSGKVYEFIFFDSKEELKLREEVVENFLFAYFDKRTTEPKESPDWTFWKKKLENGEKVPVFFQKNGKEVAHFGLSYLYKLPYSHSVKDGIPSSHNDSRKDLAQTIFGYIGKDEALKGRVQFSHFKAIKNIEISNSVTEVLGTPRASYYPMYVKQESGKLFTTFMDSGFEISGRKRYPIHKSIKSYPLPTNKDGKVNEKVGTTFTPLKEGVVFEGKVRYHNLKKAELGALLSALTFHNTKECFHNIGMAKSLGYGKIKLEINGIELNEYLKVFETEVTSSISNWAESEQLSELLTMATEQDNEDSSELRYMELKEFAKHKSRDKDYLRNYTALDNIKRTTIKSLISQEDLEALRERQAQREKEELELQRKREAEEKHDKEWRIVYETNNIYTIENFIKKYPTSKYIDTAKSKIEELKEKEQELQKQEAQKEANEKWIAIQKVDKKYYQKALDDFIDNYPNSSFIEKANEILASIKGDTKPKNNKTLDFSQAKDGKAIERAMKVVQNPSEEDKNSLEEAIKSIYPNLNAKKKKQFKKMKLMVKWLGQERFERLLS